MTIVDALLSSGSTSLSQEGDMCPAGSAASHTSHPDQSSMGRQLKPFQPSGSRCVYQCLMGRTLEPGVVFIETWGLKGLFREIRYQRVKGHGPEGSV